MRYETSYETSPTSVLYINYFAVVVLFIARILHQHEPVFLQRAERRAWLWGRAPWKPNPLQVISPKPCPPQTASQTTLQTKEKRVSQHKQQLQPRRSGVLMGQERPPGAPQATASAKVSGTDMVPKNPWPHKDLQGEESIHCTALTDGYFFFFPLSLRCQG